MLVELGNNISIYFNKEELRSLCFDLGINFENVPGETLEVISKELVNFCQRHGRLPELIHRCRELRPNADWSNYTNVDLYAPLNTFPTQENPIVQSISNESISESTKDLIDTTPLDIRLVDSICYVDCSGVNESGLLVNSMAIDWNRLKFRWKKEGTESYLSSTIAILNHSKVPVFISGIRCEVSRSSFNINSHTHSHILVYPDSNLRIIETLTNKMVLIESWYRINNNEKILWDLWVNLEVVPPFRAGESHIDKVLLELSFDIGKFNCLLDFSNKAIQWRCLENARDH